jgi:5-methylcytosine-specific restriction endonuclease McrA
MKVRTVKTLKSKKSTKGSNYIGVYQCSKTKLYYSKNYRNKRCYKSELFKKEIDAAKKYDNFILKNDPLSKKINFPQISKINKKISIKNRILLLKKKDITKRPRIPEFIKIIVYSRQDDKCTLCKNSLGIGRIIDHIIPRSQGGLDNINNYQAICGSCNKWKTYRFDHFIKNYLKNNKKFNLDTILKIQKTEFQKFNGPYPF